MPNKATITNAKNKVQHIKAAYSQCASPFLFQKLVDAQRSLKKQKQKFFGQQGNISFNL